jgi:hypothetical protein
MKLTINFILVFYSLLGTDCYAQNKKGELIPLINHSYKIDSLLNSLVEEGGSLSNDSCFSISVEKNNDISFLNILSVDKVDVNNILNSARLKNEHIGFFNLKKYKVFVMSSKEFEGLFSQTSFFRRIDFIDFSRKSNIQTPSVPEIRFLANFTYQNGKFSPTYDNK